MLAAVETDLLTGGFRAGKPELLRLHLEQTVCGGAVVSDTVRRVLAGRSRAKTLTGLLSLEALKDMRPALSALLTPEVVIVAGLLDGRPEVRRAAEGWLEDASGATQQPQQQPPPPPSAEEATETLRAYFSDLHGLLGRSGAAAPAMTGEAWRMRREELEGEIRALRAENRRLKGAEDRAAMFSQKLKKAEAALVEDRRLREAAEADARGERRQRIEAEAELAREAARREERLKAAVDLALSQEFFGWLRDARAVEAEARSPGKSGDLLERAEAALERQAAVDRHAGNRRTLSLRLERLRAARGKVRDALANALRQAPALKRAEAELTGEIGRIEALLSPGPAAESPLEESLRARIEAAEENALPALRRHFSSLAALGVLTEEARERLKAAFQRRVAAIDALGAAAPAKEGEGGRPAGPGPSPEALLLGGALEGRLPLILLLDGHNVLFGLPARYSPPRGQSRTDAEKRECVARDVARLLAPNPAVRAWIVFDGKTQSDRRAAPNVRVSYSGGEGEHRADKALLDNIRFFQTADPETALLLVSNDRDLCARARRLGAKTMGVLELGAFFPNPD